MAILFLVIVKWPEVVAPHRHIAWAELVEGNLKLSVLTKKKKNEKLSLVHITGVVPEAKKDAAKEFVDAVMDATYKGVPPSN